MIHQTFAGRAAEIVSGDKDVVGLAVAGSWITNELDEYSDLDLILFTRNIISGDKDKMLAYAKRFGKLLSAFTGEHVGEPRVLICLYDDPLLHVDIKFLTPEEFNTRIEDPVILYERDSMLSGIIKKSAAAFPKPDPQWIEDRFWTWVHYALLKIGRGELLEAFDFLAFLRMTVLGPLIHLKNGNLPRGVRKVESLLSKNDLEKLISTVPAYSKDSLLDGLFNAVSLYRELRPVVTDKHLITEERVMAYFNYIKTHAR